MLRRCHANPAPLSAWEAAFLADLARRGGEPSPAQAETLERIAGRLSAREVAAQLAARVETLATVLVGDGPTTRRGTEWRFRRKGSLAVVVAGADRGKFFDHEAGTGGDALGMVCHLRQCGTAEALEWATAWLGAAPAPAIQPRTAAAEAPSADAAERSDAAVRMWLDAEPALAGTPAARYLAARGIDLAALGRQPRCLRFAPALWNRETDRRWPAMVAAITAGDGEHIGTHRTWLAQDGAGVWRKAPLNTPKMSFGRVAGGAIRLWRGASRRPLRQAPVDDRVVIAEGIETALAIALAVPGYRVLAAVSLGNLGGVALPPQLRHVILAADNDPGDAARRAFQRAVEQHLAAGRSVRVARPEVGKDFNDVLAAWTA